MHVGAPCRITKANDPIIYFWSTPNSKQLVFYYFFQETFYSFSFFITDHDYVKDRDIYSKLPIVQNYIIYLCIPMIVTRPCYIHSSSYLVSDCSFTAGSYIDKTN